RVADVVCFDPTRVAARAPEKVHDFPGGAARYVVRAEGVERVLIRGEEFMARGEWAGAHPGVVLDGAAGGRCLSEPPALVRVIFSAPARPVFPAPVRT